MLIARFYLAKVEDRTASIANGYFVWKDEERCDIIIPGEREEKVTHIVTADLLNRWRNGIGDGARPDVGHQALAEKYDRWKAGEAEPITGTPLELAGFLSPAMIENLKAPPRHCKTVEMLADLSDAQGGGIPFFMEMRKKAQLFLENRNGPAALASKQAEQATTIATQAAEIADMRNQMAELLKRLPGTGVVAAENASPTGTGVLAVDDDMGNGSAPGAIPANRSAVEKRKRQREEQEAA